MKLIEVIDECRIQILAIQETRFVSDEISTMRDQEKTGRMKYPLILGTVFFEHNSIIHIIHNFRFLSPRLSILTLIVKLFMLFNALAPINQDNKKYSEKQEEFWQQLEEELQITVLKS